MPWVSIPDQFPRYLGLGFGTAWLLLLAGCASLYQVEIGNIDNTHGPMNRVEVKSSETGVDVSQASSMANTISRSRTVHEVSNTVSSVWQLISYGPRTGNVTFSDSYADGLETKLLSSCPSHRLTGVTSIRESNHYPVISGEMVRLIGYCIPDRAEGDSP